MWSAMVRAVVLALLIPSSSATYELDATNRVLKASAKMAQVANLLAKEAVHIHSNRFALADFVQSPRRLAAAFCTWGNSTCAFTGDAWMTAQSFNNKMLSAMVTKQTACNMHSTDAMCKAAAGCVWESSACEYKISSAEEAEMIALFLPTEGCGFIGSVIAGAAKCSALEASGCAAPCKTKSGFEASSDGQSCVAKNECEADTAASLCPGMDMEAENTKCSASAPKCATGTDYSVCFQATVDHIVPCLAAACPIYGEMMGAMMPAMTACMNLKTKDDCTKNVDCTYSAEDTGQCGVNGNLLMNKLVPSTCAYSPVMTISAECAGKVESTCTNAACEWIASTTCSDDCTLACTPGTVTECTPKPTAILEAMATATADPDFKTFVTIANADMTCAKKTKETDCSAAAAPVYKTLAFGAAGSIASAYRQCGVALMPLLVLYNLAATA